MKKFPAVASLSQVRVDMDKKDYYFASKDDLVEFVKSNIEITMNTEYGYYGDNDVYATVKFLDEQVAFESTYVSSSGCNCYGTCE